MKTKLLQDTTPRTWVLVFESGDAVVSELLRFARDSDLHLGHFTAIGAFENATLYYFDWETKRYVDNPVEEQVEVLALTGNIAEKDGDLKVHAHVALGTRAGDAKGGHLKEARVRPTLEVFLSEEPGRVQRKKDAETGLALMSP